ncbi:hypothetical protein F5B21DRAFT_127105 [Xylaria acuta]|nr:hypothetical protein F5B21DRAFT_127105 [Xylaria acuta]
MLWDLIRQYQWFRKQDPVLSVPIDDIEANRPNPNRQHLQQRAILIRHLFNLETPAVELWPGIQTYFSYIETQFERVGPARFQSVWPKMGYSLPPSVEDCLRFISSIVTACRRLDRGLSIDEVLQEIVGTSNDSSANSADEREFTPMDRQAVFTVLAWLTMLVRPSLKTSNENYHIVVEKKLESLQSMQPLDSATSPMFDLFRGFGCNVPCEASERSKNREETLLRPSSLDFFYLKTVGKVKIRWTYNLDSHLRFDQRSGTLSLFCLPTYCALHILSEHNGGSLFDHILCDDPDVQSHDQSYISLYKREVLLSYRLLFSTKKAQMLFRKKEQRKISGVGGMHDPLLGILCGQSCEKGIRLLPPELWLETWRDVTGHLYDQDAYSTDTDFPIFGTRLLELQTFSLSQKAGRLRDIWRDKRDTAQWYTFWAVLVIGGLALLVSLVQVALAVAQLRAA